MKKIIVTLTIVTLFATAEKATAQRAYRVISAEFPFVNIRTGVNAELSTRLWRFEPFFKLGAYVQLFRERGAYGWEFTNWQGEHQWESGGEHYTPRFADIMMGGLGINFRITDNDRIRFEGEALSTPGSGSGFGRLSGTRAYLGYVRTQNLSQRTSVDLYFLHTLLDDLSRNWFDFADIVIIHRIAKVGGRLNYEIIPNLKLNVQLEYARRYNLSAKLWAWSESEIELEGLERILTRNLINFSVGIHYRIPPHASRGEPRERTAQPTQRHQALPCPPWQMQNRRDRTPPVFNHPSGR
ncbi:MAG: hypothetical protein FWD02_04710 [Bacteroidales bacterium]|nr:hypothetical protein [Bacteroidales bacterium]